MCHFLSDANIGLGWFCVGWQFMKIVLIWECHVSPWMVTSGFLRPHIHPEFSSRALSLLRNFKKLSFAIYIWIRDCISSPLHIAHCIIPDAFAPSSDMCSLNVFWLCSEYSLSVLLAWFGSSDVTLLHRAAWKFKKCVLGLLWYTSELTNLSSFTKQDLTKGLHFLFMLKVW